MTKNIILLLLFLFICITTARRRRSQEKGRDFYKILGVGRSVNSRQLKKQFRKLGKK